MSEPTHFILGTTSIHGLQQAGRKSSYGIKSILLWCCIFLGSITAMFMQINQVTKQLLSFPKAVRQENYGGTMNFPAVTVCSLGLIKKSAVMQIPTFVAMVVAMSSAGTPQENTTIVPSTTTTTTEPTTSTTSTSTTTSISTAVTVPTTTQTTDFPTSALITTTISSAKLQCQQSCDKWEPFCFVNVNPAQRSNFGAASAYCRSIGGNLPSFPTSNYTEAFIAYVNASNTTWSYYYWSDYTNFSPHNVTNAGIWTDSFGRTSPNLTWYNTCPRGSWASYDYSSSAFMPHYSTFCDFDSRVDFPVVCACHCPSIQPPYNGIINGDNYTNFNMTIQFSCNPVSRMVGSPITTCIYVRSGVDWSTPVPICLAACTPLVATTFVISYSNMINNVTSSGTIANFACRTNYTLYGRNSTTCFNGSWDIASANYPLCSDATFPSLSSTAFLNLASGNSTNSQPPNSVSLAAAFTSMLTSITAGLDDTQMAAIGFGESDTIANCVYNGKVCDNESIQSVRDYKDGMCYTFNHRNMSHFHTADKSGELYGLKLLLYSEQGEYLSTVISGGLKMIIHDQNDPIFHGPPGFMLTPGLTYSISLEKTMEIRLNVPNDKCVNDATNMPYYFFTNTSYCREACIDSYVQSQSVKNCSCNDPSLPINDTKMPLCGISQLSCVQAIYDRTTLIEDASLFCPPPCSSTYYKRISTAFQSRPNEGVMTKRNISQEEYLQNSVEVSIYFRSLEVMTLREVLSYTVINLLSDLGATMGVLVGMSVISWVEFFYAMGQFVKVLLHRAANRAE